MVVPGAGGVPYLDKFVVTPDAQGEGLGAALWQVLRARFPALYWRARSSNPVANWYFQQATTAERRGPWVAYTVGVEDPQTRLALAEDALNRDSCWQEDAP